MLLTISISQECDDFEIIGCINPIACNFDPEATDESTCTYPELYYDCSEACITDTDGDGICDELEIVGCTDPMACNYLDIATDEGSCEYAGSDNCDVNVTDVVFFAFPNAPNIGL